MEPRRLARLLLYSGESAYPHAVEAAANGNMDPLITLLRERPPTPGDCNCIADFLEGRWNG